MQSLAVFDIIILSITLILGLKGLMKGLIKEIFGIIGIIGALFVASRSSNDVGNIIAPVLGLESQSTISLIGFIASLVGFWLIVYIIGTAVSKIFAASGLGIFDRVFGFIFGAGKIFLIFAVIAHALYQINSFRKTIDEKTAQSVVMPYLLKTGAFIMKLDEIQIDPNSESSTDKIIKSAQDGVKAIKEKQSELTEKVTDVVSEKVGEVINNKIDETKTISQEQIDELKKQLEETSKTTTEEKTNN